MTKLPKFEITSDFPPAEIYDVCVRRFGADFRKGTIFTYGDKIHVFQGFLPEDLIVHEITHVAQQKKMGVKKWWDKYLSDDSFRLAEEIMAYRNQYQWAQENLNRQGKRNLLRLISKTLSSRLYGKIITEEEARNAISS